jgi:RNA polymerase sigma-70 factor (ECF subfamily)
MEKVSYVTSVAEEEAGVTGSHSEAAGKMLYEKKASVADNEQLIRHAFDSDPKLGCELLYRHYYARLCSHASRFVYSKSIAEDIVSDIFCQFYQKGTFREITSSYRAFLYKSVRNKAYNYIRLEANRSIGLNSSHEDYLAASPQPDGILQYEELYQQVEATVNSLPAQCRKIYLMYRFEDKKYAEIAEALHLSPRTVEVQIRKASQYVKKVLSKNWIFLLLLLNYL